MLDKPHAHAKSMLDVPVANRMPREIAPGVFWIGDCLAQRHKGKSYHGYNAAFLVAGETASCLVETGHPKDFPVIEQHMPPRPKRISPACPTAAPRPRY